MKKDSYIFLLLLCFVISIHSQQNNNKTRILKSTINTVSSSAVSIPNLYIAQSIGQSGIIGKIDLETVSVQQGFLTNSIWFKINNQNNETVEETLEFVISPNPFVEYIQIDFTKTTNDNIYIKIYDLNGKIHKTKEYLPTNKIVIPLPRLSVGVYIIQIKSSKHLITKKILKKDR